MDKADRILYLRQLIIEDPEDPFAHYALCLEQEGTMESTTKMWEEMLEKFPEYFPSYYKAGEAFKEAGDKEKAVAVWKKGTEIALKLGSAHAVSEFKSAIQNALIEEEDD